MLLNKEADKGFCIQLSLWIVQSCIIQCAVDGYIAGPSTSEVDGNWISHPQIVYNQEWCV